MNLVQYLLQRPLVLYLICSLAMNNLVVAYYKEETNQQSRASAADDVAVMENNTCGDALREIPLVSSRLLIQTPVQTDAKQVSRRRSAVCVIVIVVNHEIRRHALDLPCVFIGKLNEVS